MEPGLMVTGRLALVTVGVRAAGARVGLRTLLRARRTLAEVDAGDPGGAYRALRAVLCTRPEDVTAFDAVFAEWMADALPRPVPVED
jgi:uncharacterized protein with von Willebrand factor type A (vWA) domain